MLIAGVLRQLAMIERWPEVTNYGHAGYNCNRYRIAGIFSRGIYFAHFVERAQFTNLKSRNLIIESGCGQLPCD